MRVPYDYHLMLPLICLICNIFIVPSATTSNGSALVHTSYGTLEGFVHALGNGKSMDVFLGIPYAEPPIGELRFEVDAMLGRVNAEEHSETIGATQMGGHTPSATQSSNLYSSRSTRHF